MTKKSSFFEFRNIGNDTADLYIYGEIVLEKESDFWTGEISETEVGLMDFKKSLEEIEDSKNLNLYVNSPGGSVFVASSMASMLQRLQRKGTQIHAYIDGLAASAASFLVMCANDINLYKNSILMIHKPMTMSFGNANDLRKDIVALDKIESGVMMPLYMSKALVDESEIENLINEETWLDSKETAKYFDVNILENEKKVVAICSDRMFKNYKNIPDILKNQKENKSQIESRQKELELKLKIIKNKYARKGIEIKTISFFMGKRRKIL